MFDLVSVAYPTLLYVLYCRLLGNEFFFFPFLDGDVDLDFAFSCFVACCYAFRWEPRGGEIKKVKQALAHLVVLLFAHALRAT